MNKFSYLQPKTLSEASKMLQKDWKEALPYAGGIDLLGLIKDSIESPKQVVNLKSLPDLNQIDYQSGKGLKIGALVTIAEIVENPDIKNQYPLLNQAAKEVASPQLRNIGTIGGNICQRPRCWYYRGDFDCLRKGGELCYAADGKNKYHCIIGGSPCYIVHPSDLAVALMVLDAKLSIYSGGKIKQVAISDFFVLPEENVERENILKPGEIVVEIYIPALKENVRSGYLKFKEREVWDFAVVSVGAMIEKNGGNIRSGRVVLGGVAPIPWYEKTVSDQLADLKPSEESLNKVTNDALKNNEPLAMNKYKIPLAKNLIKRLLDELVF